ncbi:MAG TPA: transcriptional regulator [Humisphaera sp.]
MAHDAPLDAFDPLVVNPGRLSILTALATGADDAGGTEFVHVRRVTRLTDGNLASHAKRLADGGLIEVQKQFKGGKPVTSYLLTPAGRDALAAHVRRVSSAVGVGGRLPPAEPHPEVRRIAAAPVSSSRDESDWID